MAGGGFVVDSPTGAFDGKITLSVFITCIVVASSGLILGYDIGVSGGVTTMVPFLQKFFPNILRKIAGAGVEVNIYCVYDSQVLTLFTSSFYLAALITSIAASRITATLGRRNSIMLGGLLFFAGSAVNGGAQNIAMLILGRMLLGFGVGFTNQAAPVYLAEIAPPKWRGAFSTGYIFFIGLGVLAAGCINYATAKHKWGWRVSLGAAIVPAAIMTIGAFFVTDTPASLVERGQIDQARKALRKTRGSSIDVEPELEQLIKMSQLSKSVKEEPFRTIFERQYRPHLVMALAVAFFQQLTGITIVAFYAPNLFQSIGLGHDAALLSGIILGLVNVASVLASSLIVDRFGRRFLFITGGITMFVFMVAVSAVLAVTTGVDGTKVISKGNAVVVLVLLCIYAAGFGWSWAPLPWVVSSEIFPFKIRPTGVSITTAMQYITLFILAQTFLTMLCHFKFGAFLFYAGWLVVMTTLIILFLPETKGVPLEAMNMVWAKHWFWRRYVKEIQQENNP